MRIKKYLVNEIGNKRELQNIAITHSADIYYGDFIKIYRECTKEPYNFLAIDTTLPTSDQKEVNGKCINFTITL